MSPLWAHRAHVNICNVCLEFTGVITFPTSTCPNMQMNAPFNLTQATEHAQQRISNERCGSAADHSDHGGENLQLAPDPGCRGVNCPPELAEFSGRNDADLYV
ncbi:unnamed protein product [Tetraodon nigroviridis]|uniref:(spotted green pufferfish) hypothetical protein n=1 Tax=Tetraodon nigroviridis TaxID=99883 RepID=Q4S794_TETNG|nr:unnamed protein product [Tetraodon nigroviridis]